MNREKYIYLTKYTAFTQQASIYLHITEAVNKYYK